MSPLTAVDWYVACLLDRITGKQVRGLGEAKAGYQHATAQLSRAEDALREIRDSEGKVCPEYETCEHVACQSSYAAWAIADAALADAVADDIAAAFND